MGEKAKLKKIKHHNAIPNYDWLMVHMLSQPCAPGLEDLKKSGYPDYIEKNLYVSIELVKDAYESCNKLLRDTCPHNLLRTIYIHTFYYYDRISDKIKPRFYTEKPHMLIDGSDMIITLKGTDGRYYGTLPGYNFSMKIKIQIGKHTERDTDVSRKIDIYQSVDTCSDNVSVEHAIKWRIKLL